MTYLLCCNAKPKAQDKMENRVRRREAEEGILGKDLMFNSLM